jgi:cell division protein ZapA (FtsZ GTPase activity inhibitor)
MPNEQKNGIIDYVPKDQAAISVAEIIDPDLSYKVIEYNHHSMKGDFSRKRDTILALADKLEPQRAELKKANSSLETDLFFLLNNINLRHNNNDPNGKNYKAYIAGMKQENLEEWYDDTYQMCLLAFLELDNKERKDRVKQLKQDIQNC